MSAAGPAEIGGEPGTAGTPGGGTSGAWQRITGPSEAAGAGAPAPSATGRPRPAIGRPRVTTGRPPAAGASDAGRQEASCAAAPATQMPSTAPRPAVHLPLMGPSSVRGRAPPTRLPPTLSLSSAPRQVA